MPKLVQREGAEEEEEELVQPKLAPGTAGTAGPSIESGISALEGGGNPLSGTERSFFGPRLGADLSGVRVHDNSRAHEAASSINARAFTLGNDIAFAKGEYSPGTEGGNRLMAHELAHVVQQGGADGQGIIRRKETKEEQAKRLKEANEAAQETATKETGVSAAKPHWATTIDTAHLDNLEKVLKYITSKEADLKDGVAKADSAADKLGDARNRIDETRKGAIKATSKGYGKIGPITIFEKAIQAVDEAKALLEESRSKGINGLDSWIELVETLSAKFTKAKDKFWKNKEVDLDVLDALKEDTSKLKTKFNLDRNIVYSGQPGAARRARFVLRYFLSLNKTGFTDAPTLKESSDIRTNLGMLDSDLKALFGGSSVDYMLFRSFEVQLKHQIWVRSAMEAALGKDPGAKPDKASVERWFEKLKKASNSDLKTAYWRFASGFFIHRHEPDPAVIGVKQSLDTLFKRSTTLSGARLAVCAGFAVLGKELLEKSGAKFKYYYIGLQASDYQVKCSTVFDNIHAIAHLSRKDPGTKKNEDMYVSNQSIEPSKEAGIGPDAGVWDNDNPIYEGKGKTIQKALDDALKKVEKKKKSKSLDSILCDDSP